MKLHDAIKKCSIDDLLKNAKDNKGLQRKIELTHKALMTFFDETELSDKEILELLLKGTIKAVLTSKEALAKHVETVGIQLDVGNIVDREDFEQKVRKQIPEDIPEDVVQEMLDRAWDDIKNDIQGPHNGQVEIDIQ